jgi:hypothetical protein
VPGCRRDDAEANAFYCRLRASTSTFAMPTLAGGSSMPPAGLQNSHGMPVAQPHASAIHHDSVPDNLKETWQYEGKNYSYSDRFSGYAIFVSNDNADRAASLAFGHSLGQELQKHGLHYTPHYTLPLMGRYRQELIDEEAGVYRYDHLVLHSAHMPAVLLEAGSIINRQEELELATPKRRLMVAKAVTASVEEFCASRGQAVVGRPPASNPASVAITTASRGIRLASLSRHKRIHSAKT